MEDYEELIGRLERIRGRKVGTLQVDGVELVVAKLLIRGMFPKLEKLEYFKFE
jgi:tryptophan 2,3-dioxygenase